MVAYKIRIPNNGRDEIGSREVIGLIRKLHKNNFHRKKPKIYKIAVEVLPREGNFYKSRAPLYNIARETEDYHELIPLLLHEDITHRAVFHNLSFILLEKSEWKKTKTVREIAEEEIRELQQEIDGIMSMEEQMRECAKYSSSTGEILESVGPMRAKIETLQRLMDEGHLDSLESAEKAKAEAQEKIEAGMRRIIDETEPDLIIVCRFLRDDKIPPYENIDFGTEMD